jgi:hypothetical protein
MEWRRKDGVGEALAVTIPILTGVPAKLILLRFMASPAMGPATGRLGPVVTGSLVMGRPVVMEVRPPDPVRNLMAT